MTSTHLHHDIALAQPVSAPVIELQVDFTFEHYAVVDGVGAMETRMVRFEAFTESW
ncbi:hypothetical protein D9M71_832520 [compost metagenome]